MVQEVKIFTMYLHTIEVLIAVSFDLILGDPSYSAHPVRLIGALIEKLHSILEKFLPKTPSWQIFSGFIILSSVGSLVYLNIHLIIFLFKKLIGQGFWYYLLVGFVSSFSFAIKELFVSTVKVYKSLSDLPIAREKLSMLVGRDTHSLNEEEILMATTETLVENLSDSVIAPLFYLFIGGPAFAYLYRAINTMDAMLGYKDSRFRYIGFFPAKADDLMNFIPSRITAVFIILSGMILSGFIKPAEPLKAIKTVIGEARKHPSPNAGYPEAAIAGLLGIRLLGPSRYRGQLVNKPFLNPEGRIIEKKDFRIVVIISVIAILLYLISTLLLWKLIT